MIQKERQLQCLGIRMAVCNSSRSWPKYTIPMHIYAGSTNALTTNVKTKCIAENRPKRNGKGTEEELHSFGRRRRVFQDPHKSPRTTQRV